MQFVVFVKFTCVYLHQIVPEIMQLLMNNLSKKTSQEVKTDRILTPHKLYLLFALMFTTLPWCSTKNALFFTQPGAHTFFMCTIMHIECLQLGHQISNIAPPLYNNYLPVNDPYSTGKLKFSIHATCE